MIVHSNLCVVHLFHFLSDINQRLVLKSFLVEFSKRHKMQGRGGGLVCLFVFLFVCKGEAGPCS